MKGSFLLTAMLIPVIEASAGTPWLPAAVMGILCTILIRHSGEGRSNWWLRFAQGIWLILVAAEFLNWTHSSWNGKMSEYAVPAVLLLLACCSVKKGRGSAVAAVNVLRIGLVFAAVIICVSGVKQIELHPVKPQWDIGDGKLLLVLLLPLTAGKRAGGTGVKAAVLAVWASSYLAAAGSGGLYDLCRNMNGAVRLDSLAASAITVGSFALLVYLLQSIQELQSATSESIVPLAAIAAYAVYAVGWIPDRGVLSLGIVLLWCILPKAMQITKEWRKIKKDKNSA